MWWWCWHIKTSTVVMPQTHRHWFFTTTKHTAPVSSSIRLSFSSRIFVYLLSPVTGSSYSFVSVFQADSFVMRLLWRHRRRRLHNSLLAKQLLCEMFSSELAIEEFKDVIYGFVYGAVYLFGSFVTNHPCKIFRHVCKILNLYNNIHGNKKKNT